MKIMDTTHFFSSGESWEIVDLHENTLMKIRQSGFWYSCFEIERLVSGTTNEYDL